MLHMRWPSCGALPGCNKPAAAAAAVLAGEEDAHCQSLIEAHKKCLRLEGFNVSYHARSWPLGVCHNVQSP